MKAFKKKKKSGSQLLRLDDTEDEKGKKKLVKILNSSGAYI